MKKIVIILLLCIFITGCVPKTEARKSELEEEVFPIRENSQIIGFNYFITLPENYDYSKVIRTHIMESINHYKDISLVEKLYVTVTVKNQTNDVYKLREVCIKNQNIVFNRFLFDIKVLNHKTNTFSFLLKGPLQENSFIEFIFE